MNEYNAEVKESQASMLCFVNMQANYLLLFFMVDLYVG